MKKKIAIADNNGGKFTQDLMDHWMVKGHEVKFERGASEYLAQWADVYYVDTWDNNIHYLYKLYHGDEGVSRPEDWDNSEKPRIVVRALDWEVWIGMARDQNMIDWVDDVVYITKHIGTELQKHGSFANKLHLIRPGVNLERYSLKTSITDGFQLGMALGDMWKYKNHMGGLDIFTALYRRNDKWRLHIRGQHENGTYDPTNFEYYLKSRGIENVVTVYDHMVDMNDFYDKIDILLHPGQKEAFCYSVGEAMAKGIPAVINDFYGSENIWHKAMLYKTHEDAVDMIRRLNIVHTPTPKEIRGFIEHEYDATRMMQEYDTLLGL